MTRKQIIKNKKLKRLIAEISYKFKLGHIGSCLTAVDIIQEIYDSKKPDEKFVLSSGHAHLAHLVVMVNEGAFRDRETLVLEHFEALIKKYGIHCDRQSGCDVSTGSLGHGIGIAVGMALADRSNNVYCLLSDGECAEGSVYEAINIIIDQRISNIRLYINDNGYGAYRKSNLSEIFYDKSFINIVETDMNDYPEWLRGQIAHYKVLDKKEYTELMEVLK